MNRLEHLTRDFPDSVSAYRPRVLKDPMPSSYVSACGVSYRTVERVAALFDSEKSLERVVLFLHPWDETNIEGAEKWARRYYDNPWFPGVFGGLLVSSSAPKREPRLFRARGEGCHPHMIWREVSSQRWTEVVAGDRKLPKRGWAWDLGDAVVEWYRDKAGITIGRKRRDGQFRPRWPRREWEGRGRPVRTEWKWQPGDHVAHR